MAQDNAFNTSDRKYLLEINAVGFSMDTDDFDVVLKRGSKSLIFHKDDLVVEPYTVVENNITIEKNHYYVCFATDDFGPGDVTVVVTAYVPDTDFDSGFRREVDKFNLVNVKAI